MKVEFHIELRYLILFNSRINFKVAFLPIIPCDSDLSRVLDEPFTTFVPPMEKSGSSIKIPLSSVLEKDDGHAISDLHLFMI